MTAKKHHRPVVWSFFSGAMGLDLGLEAEGWCPSLAVEIEPKFCATIKRNRPSIHVIESDVADLNAFQLHKIAGVKNVDLMVGGPPCQSFSTGGNRAALNDTRGNAIFEYLRLIAEVRPAMFILENVANLITAAIQHRPISKRPGKSWNLSSYSTLNQPTLFQVEGEPAPLKADEQSGSAIRYLLSTVIADLNYNVRFAILNAADYGVPQNRLRFVMIGFRDTFPPKFINPTHGTPSQRFMTVLDAIGDLESEPGPGSQYQPKTKSFFDLVPPGGNWRDLPHETALEAMGKKSLRAGGGKTGFFRRLSWDGQSPTITGKPNRKGSAMCHPNVSRPLSVHECARLQGFPDKWVIEGSIADRYTQIGNAVPVPLGRAIGATLHEPTANKLDSTDSMLKESLARLRASARNKRTGVSRNLLTQNHTF